MGIDELEKLLVIPQLSTYIAHLDDRLLKLGAQSSSLSPVVNQIIKSGGKRLRPVVLIAMAASRGKNIDDNVIAGGAVVELIHMASLVHDDLIDDSQLRRQGQTTNKRLGSATALLVGDYLLALACREAAGISQKIARLSAATIVTMCEGQAQQLAGKEAGIEYYLEVAEKKTASLFSLAATVGGLYAGLSTADINRAELYGKSFGMSFQIIDDIIDHELGAITSAQALAKIYEYNTGAAQTLNTISDHSPILQGLAELPNIYLDWAL
jgi:heptaprenyl diphosphate synthase